MLDQPDLAVFDLSNEIEPPGEEFKRSPLTNDYRSADPEVNDLLEQLDHAASELADANEALAEETKKLKESWRELCDEVCSDDSMQIDTEEH